MAVTVWTQVVYNPGGPDGWITSTHGPSMFEDATIEHAYRTRFTGSDPEDKLVLIAGTYKKGYLVLLWETGLLVVLKKKESE